MNILFLLLFIVHCSYTDIKQDLTIPEKSEISNTQYKLIIEENNETKDNYSISNYDKEIYLREEILFLTFYDTKVKEKFLLDGFSFKKIKFPDTIQSDNKNFIKINYKYYANENIWYILTFFTIGFFPYKFYNEIIYDITIHDRNGNQFKEKFVFSADVWTNIILFPLQFFKPTTLRDFYKNSLKFTLNKIEQKIIKEKIEMIDISEKKAINFRILKLQTDCQTDHPLAKKSFKLENDYCIVQLVFFNPTKKNLKLETSKVFLESLSKEKIYLSKFENPKNFILKDNLFNLIWFQFPKNQIENNYKLGFEYNNKIYYSEDTTIEDFAETLFLGEFE